MSDSADVPDSPAASEVPFDTGCLGCLLPLVLALTVLFAIAAFDGEFFAILAGSEARRNPLPALAPFSLGGVNIALLMLLVPIVWELVKLGRRFVDMKAVWIAGDAVHFHPTLRRKPIPLSDLVQVTHQAGEMKSALILRLSGGTIITVDPVDHDAAQAFAAQIEGLIGSA